MQRGKMLKRAAKTGQNAIYSNYSKKSSNCLAKFWGSLWRYQLFSLHYKSRQFRLITDFLKILILKLMVQTHFSLYCMLLFLEFFGTFLKNVEISLIRKCYKASNNLENQQKSFYSASDFENYIFSFRCIVDLFRIEVFSKDKENMY